MANGTTLTVSTREDLNYPLAVASSDAGDPGLGSVAVVFDDNEPLQKILTALDKARAHLIQTHTKR